MYLLNGDMLKGLVPKESSLNESLLDLNKRYEKCLCLGSGYTYLLPLDLLDLGIGNDSFLLAGV